MEGLYPIIRRKRRPLVTGNLPAGRQQHVEAAVEKADDEARVVPSKHDEEASTTRQSRPTVVG